MLTYKKEEKEMKNILLAVGAFLAGVAVTKLDDKFGFSKQAIEKGKKLIGGNEEKPAEEISGEEKE